MQITKARLKEIIQEELQSEGILSAFLAKRGQKDKKEKQSKFVPRELSNKEKQIVDLVKTNKELVEKAIEKLQMSSNILTNPDAQNEEIANAVKEMNKVRDALNALLIAKQPAYLKRLEEEEEKRHPGIAAPETLDDIINRIMSGGVDQSGGASDRLKKQIIDAVKKELNLKEGSYGGDGQMADSQLNTIVELATKLDMIISDDTKIPNWVKSKITKALDYISTSLNYLIGEITDAQEEMMREEKLTKPQIKDRDKRAKKIMKSTKKQYGKEEGEDIAYAIATNQVKEET